MGAGQYQTDGDTGLLLLGHRYYDASVGRFLTADPVQAGDNRYAYCGNNPLKQTDPQELCFGAVALLPLLPIPGVGEVVGIVLVVAVVIVATVVLVDTVNNRGGLPWTEPPNGTLSRDDGNGNGQTRDYGPDGYPAKDMDFGHDHGARNPHTHDIGRPVGGGPPNYKDPQPGRPVLLSD